MKKSFFLLFVLIMTSSICFGQFRSKVEERFELTSIAFMLAGAPEYNQCGIRSYERDIRDWFGKYETDKSIEFMRKLNREHAIGHNAISSVAARLQIKDGIVALHPDYTLAYICKEVDTRWTEPLLAEYIAMLNRFYKKSRFAAFYSDHGELYRVAQERMDSLLGTEATDWFERFYGEALTEKVPNTYISLVNGSSNYSLGKGGVLIGLYDDESGLPNPNSYTLAPLLHEWGHHFTAPIIRKYWPQMEKAAERIAPRVEPAMNRIGYSGAWTMTVEWLNNLFANMYFKGRCTCIWGSSGWTGATISWIISMRTANVTPISRISCLRSWHFSTTSRSSSTSYIGTSKRPIRSLRTSIRLRGRTLRDSTGSRSRFRTG